MSEKEWRGLGVQQSQGWEHYMRHGPGKEMIVSEGKRTCKGCFKNLLY